MNYNKTIRTIDAYYKLKNFNAKETIKNSGLRNKLLEEQVANYYDGFEHHYATFDDVCKDPTLFKLSILEECADLIEMYKEFDEAANSKPSIKGIGFVTGEEDD